MVFTSLSSEKLHLIYCRKWMLVSTIHRTFLRCLLYSEADCILEVSLHLQSSDSRNFLKFCFKNWIKLFHHAPKLVWKYLKFSLTGFTFFSSLVPYSSSRSVEIFQPPDTTMMSSVTVLLSCVRHGHTETWRGISLGSGSCSEWLTDTWVPKCLSNQPFTSILLNPSVVFIES